MNYPKRIYQSDHEVVYLSYNEINTTYSNYYYHIPTIKIEESTVSDKVVIILLFLNWELRISFVPVSKI
jgi:hypothetical protein